MTETFADVPRDKLLEMPVAEQMQLGMSIGLSFEGTLPISIFPRWNFLWLAADALINHLDAIPRYSAYKPKVIIRTAVGNPVPLDPGPQHTGDYSDFFRGILRTVAVVKLERASMILPAYKDAVARGGSTILTEYPALYEAT